MKFKVGQELRYTGCQTTYHDVPSSNEILTATRDTRSYDWIRVKGNKGFNNYIERKYLAPSRTHNLDLI